MARLVSIAGGGDLGFEVRLETLYQDIDAPEKRYEPEQWPGLYLRFEKGGPAVMAFRTGKYNIAGATSIEELYEAHRKFVSTVRTLLEKDLKEIDDTCEIRNMVFMDSYDGKVDFNRLIPVLGYEHIEYEPEQFPGMDYRPPDMPGLFKIFSSGKLSLTGVTDPEPVEENFERLKKLICESQP